MYNKQSCRECGASPVAHSLCGVCTKHNNWVFSECGRIEDNDHVNCMWQAVIATN